MPDICLPVAKGGYNGLYIELKRVANGRVSEEQKRWLNALHEKGYAAEVCYGADDAIKMIMKYLKGEAL